MTRADGSGSLDLLASTIVTGGRAGVISPGRLIAEDGRIVAVETAPPGAQVPERTLCPGFVDLQVNGFDDIDVNGSTTAADWDAIGATLLATGVTSWCPTLVTAPVDRYADRIGAIGEAQARSQQDAGALAARVVGAHLEGPFLGGATGAHRREDVIAPDLEWFASLPLGDVVRIVTLAPETIGAVEATRLLADRGVVVALGHSTATAEQAEACVDAGARLVTHLFNAMGPLHHRSPGLAGVALSDDRLAVSLIADGVHLDPRLVQIAARAKGPGRWVLVTDAVAWRSRRLSDRSVEVRDGAPRLPDGTLAGSALTMPVAVRTAVDAGVPLADAIAAASTTPAALLGLDDRGVLEAGRRADIVTLDPALAVANVWIS